MNVESAKSVSALEDPDSLDAPNTELTVQVQLDGSDPSKCVGIGTKLKGGIRRELICFLKRNKSTFAWSTEDMPGISIDVMSHQLNVDPSFKPIKQKRRKLGPDRARVVNDEVERLLSADSICEVKYPDWLANTVVVKKKMGNGGYALISPI